MNILKGKSKDTDIHVKNEELETAQESEEETTEEEKEEIVQDIVENGVVTLKGRHLIHCLTIIGQIEGHYTLPPQNKTTKYEHVLPQLVAIEQDENIKGLLIMINTVGGDVEAGLAIAELISGMKKPSVSIVLGGGHSIGVPLAVCTKHSFIVPSATMTLHPVRLNGLVLGVPQTFSYFERMQDRIVGFVTKNSRISADRFKELMMTTGELVMDIGSILDGETAVSEGLIDNLGSLSGAISKLYELIDTFEEEEKCKNDTDNKTCKCGKSTDDENCCHDKSNKNKQLAKVKSSKKVTSPATSKEE